jgi:hypothetical protein
MATEAVGLVAPSIALAADAGVDTRALAWAQRFAKGTAEHLAKSGVSSVETATGSTILLTGSYAYVNEGTHRNYPEPAALQDLLTKRGEDLIRGLRKLSDARITTQSLAAAATEFALQAKRKPVSTSVVARFVGKLNDLGLVAAGGKRGFVLTRDGKQRIEEAFPGLFWGPEASPLRPGQDDGKSDAAAVKPGTVEIENIDLSGHEDPLSF